MHFSFTNLMLDNYNGTNYRPQLDTYLPHPQLKNNNNISTIYIIMYLI